MDNNANNESRCAFSSPEFALGLAAVVAAGLAIVVLIIIAIWRHGATS